MQPTTTDYEFRVALPLAYEAAVAAATVALKAEGFGVLTEINVQQTLRNKLGVDFRRYVILGACNPTLAHRALAADLSIGLLLPCNVTVYEMEDGAGSVVAIVDPAAMLGVAPPSPALAEVAAEARARLQRVAQALAAH